MAWLLVLVGCWPWREPDTHPCSSDAMVAHEAGQTWLACTANTGVFHRDVDGAWVPIDGIADFEPTHLSVGPTGAAYVSGSGSAALIRVDADGTVTTLLAEDVVPFDAHYVSRPDGGGFLVARARVWTRTSDDVPFTEVAPTAFQTLELAVYDDGLYATIAQGSALAIAVPDGSGDPGALAVHPLTDPVPGWPILTVGPSGIVVAASSLLVGPVLRPQTPEAWTTIEIDGFFQGICRRDDTVVVVGGRWTPDDRTEAVVWLSTDGGTSWADLSPDWPDTSLTRCALLDDDTLLVTGPEDGLQLTRPL